MTILQRLTRTTAMGMRRLLGTGLLVWAVGIASTPAQAAVTVDQAPLTVQQSLPPNIMLMLDDSGSMAWNFMPDICYISGVTCSTASDGSYYRVTGSNNANLVNPYYNGIYYDPTVTYAPPPKADGTRYGNSPGLTSAWVDGFASSPVNVNLTAYNGAYEAYFDYGGLGTGKSNITFSMSRTVGTPGSQTYNNVPSDSDCYYNYVQKTAGATSYNYSSAKLTCTVYFTTYTTYRYFQYAVGSASTMHYVATSDCGGLSNCVLAGDTSGVAAPAGIAAGQNIANWFSYYHTRLLMAKSGLMNAFSSVNPRFRVGFGSINNSNTDGITATGHYTSAYNSKYLAQVQPFGNGANGTQKAYFWNWVSQISAGSSTPLRKSLDAVGQYYGSYQPWSSMSSDPDGASGELACRQAYTILTTDGFWNGSAPGVGNKDGVDGATVSGANGQSYTYKASPPYSDSVDDTLADVAMKYWMSDLRTSTTNEVPTSNEDPAFWQHMATFTMGMGFSPSGITPSGTSTQQIFNWANGGSAITGFGWPTPSSDSIYNIADLAHAAVDGHGGFYSAKSPDAFASGMKDALKRASERVGTGASLAANSTSLDTGTVAYQANYYTAKWKGDLKALRVDSTTGAIATAPMWTAVSQLPAATSRNIWTYAPDGKNNNRYVAFTYTALSGTSASNELAALSSSATAQQNIIDYLRGSAALEQKNGGSYRNRDTPLGDIVDSQPVYVGKPDANRFYTQTFSGSDKYTQFASDQSTRTAAIYVAANDGMLHGFNATTGVELFAYLPAAVIKDAGIKDLASPDYGNTIEHQYFNDGELTVADVYLSNSWHTVLVGTTGKGRARAIYALDITDPANVAFLWEHSAAETSFTGSSYIGQMTGKPVVAQTADGTWSVLIGNGYNSSNGTAALLQFNLSSGALSVHQTSDPNTDNGLAAPAVWIGTPSNGLSTVAYAGDLHGHVWSFDLSSSTSTGSLLFTAKDASGNPQPITAGLLVGMDPATSNVWVFFGTGKYLASGDLTDKSSQTWYGLIVKSATSGLVSNLASGRSALQQRAIIGETAGNPAASPPVLPGRVVTPAPDTPDMDGKSGWYMDLLTPASSGSGTAEGERMVTPNQFQGNLLLATTRIPQATDLCNPSGRGWIMAVDPFTGTNPSEEFFDVNGDGSIDASDMVTVDGKSYPAAGVGFTSLPNNPIFVGGTMLVSFDNGSASSISTSNTTGSMRRVSWRELIGQ